MQCLQRYAGLLRNAVLKSIQPFTLRTPNICQMCQTQLNQYQTSNKQTDHDNHFYQCFSLI